MERADTLPPDRYNNIGEWKPLVYAGDTTPLNVRVNALSDDEYVQGTLHYLMVTGKRGIEFVVRTSLQLPADHVHFGNQVQLWLCPPVAGPTYGGYNVHIYDGWYQLRSDGPEHIRLAIESIGHLMNRMAFAFGATVDWRVKYSTASHTGAYATPSTGDLQVLAQMISPPRGISTESIIDTSIDWYNRGRTSHSVTTAFLCYYIALESLALAVIDGDADFGLEYARPDKGWRRQERLDCINSLYANLYVKDPAEFVREAYFECIVGLKKKVRQAIELVFGEDHHYLKALFEKIDGESLSDLRGKLAHGSIALINREDERILRNRLGEIGFISHDFVTQVIRRSRADPGAASVSWSGLHALEVVTSDPRNSLFATDLRMFPTADWKIRPEWCD